MIATKHITLADTTEQPLFEVPDGFLIIITYVFVANHGGSPNNIDLFWTEGGTPQVYIFDGKQVPAADNVSLGGQSDSGLFVLHEGETVKTQANSAGNMEVVVTFKLEPNDNKLSGFN